MSELLKWRQGLYEQYWPIGMTHANICKEPVAKSHTLGQVGEVLPWCQYTSEPFRQMLRFINLSLRTVPWCHDFSIILSCLKRTVWAGKVKILHLKIDMICKCALGIEMHICAKSDVSLQFVAEIYWRVSEARWTNKRNGIAFYWLFCSPFLNVFGSGKLPPKRH